MRLEEFSYHLPKEQIAQTPLSDRSSSKLLVLERKTGEITHDIFKNIGYYLRPGDCLVLNDTKVIPARLFGEKEGSGGHVELLLLKRRSQNEWEVLTKPGKKAKPGARFVFGNGELAAQVKEVIEDGLRIVEFSYEGIFEEVLDRLGQMPLPPYITEKLEDQSRYQTVYSKSWGSAAAPTAGLHFTQDLMERLAGMGISLAFLTLHVGLGTFRPVKAENIEEHIMHSEFYMVDKATCDKINRTKLDGGRVICVGTTSARTLETIADESGFVSPRNGFTDIFIYPGYKFKITDALLTNFHLPQSTLLMLISAFYNREEILKAYNEAVAQQYRFFSFGDAMFIV